MSGRKEAQGAIWDAIADAGLKAFPLVNAAAPIFSSFDVMDLDRVFSELRAEVTAGHGARDERIRLLEEKLKPQLKISQLAANLAIELDGRSADGLPNQHRFDLVASWFPEADRGRVEEAVAELEMLRMVQGQGALGLAYAQVWTAPSLYWAFDGLVHKFDTWSDARELGKRILEDEKNVVMRVLHQATGWDRRRFNPPMAYIKTFFPKGRYSGEVQDTYPTVQVLPLPEERFKIRRFVEKGN